MPAQRAGGVDDVGDEEALDLPGQQGGQRLIKTIDDESLSSLLASVDDHVVDVPNGQAVGQG